MKALLAFLYYSTLCTAWGLFFLLVTIQVAALVQWLK